MINIKKNDVYVVDKITITENNTARSDPGKLVTMVG